MLFREVMLVKPFCFVELILAGTELILLKLFSILNLFVSVLLGKFRQDLSRQFQLVLNFSRNSGYLVTRGGVSERISPSHCPGDGKARALWLFLTMLVKARYISKKITLPSTLQ